MPQEQTDLSRRERQIMDVIYRRGQATVSEVLEELPEPPGYSAVRAMLRKLEEKGHLEHREDGPRYVYQATLSRDKASKTAMERVLSTFFDGSPFHAVATILDQASTELSEEELDRLARLIRQARKRGR
jgi:predicted transcriptional regulator